jgi:hypothetical protein
MLALPKFALKAVVYATTHKDPVVQ